MQQTATITSKRQLTIPVEIFNLLKLEEGYKVIVSIEDQVIRITPAVNLVEKLAGSVKLPEKYQGLSVKQTIKKAKTDYFRQKTRDT